MNTKSLKNPRVLTGIVLGAVITGAIFWFLSSTYQVSIFNTNTNQFILGPSVEMESGFMDSNPDGFMDSNPDGFMDSNPDGFMDSNPDGMM